MSLVEREVRKSNALVEASYRLTVYEQRIILACLAQVRKGEEVTSAKMYRINAADIAESSNVSTVTAYEQLKSAADKLLRRLVTLYRLPDGNKPGKEIVTHWVQTCAYAKKEGYVEVRFGTDVIPYLTKLEDQFTWYMYKYIAEMSSAHAIRLYEMLMQWVNTHNRREIEISWFRKVMQLEDSYPSIKDFKKWVIEPAVQQINEHSQLEVKWEQRKTGRKVTHLVFHFKVKKCMLPEADANKPAKKRSQHNPGQGIWHGFTKAELDKKANPGETYEQCALRLLEDSK